MPQLPTGTVTFVFSDIEGSTGLLKRLGDAGYGTLLSVHRRLVRDIFSAHEGQEIDTQGDAFFYSFIRARQAVRACVELQRAHARASWPEEATVLVRLGLHTGEPAVGEEGYTGLDVVRASRIAAVGAGGQILVSDTTRAIIGGDVPDGVRVEDLGERELKDLDRPERIFAVVIDAEPGTADAPAEPAESAEPAASPREEPAREEPPSGRGEPSEFESIIRGARQQIEARVLSSLKSSLGEGFPFGPGPSKPPGGRSVSREISRLKALHESGALNDEQYRRAVDRLLDEEPPA